MFIQSRWCFFKIFIIITFSSALPQALCSLEPFCCLKMLNQIHLHSWGLMETHLVSVDKQLHTKDNWTSLLNSLGLLDSWSGLEFNSAGQWVEENHLLDRNRIHRWESRWLRSYKSRERSSSCRMCPWGRPRSNLSPVIMTTHQWLVPTHTHSVCLR